MSEQDKRPVYMGNFERHKKEMSVKLDDIILQLTATKQSLRYAIIISGVSLGVALVALAI
jgi:hypothetical protein